MADDISGVTPETTIETAGGTPVPGSPTPAPEAVHAAGEVETPAPGDSSASVEPLRLGRTDVEGYKKALHEAMQPAQEETPQEQGETPAEEPPAPAAEPSEQSPSPQEPPAEPDDTKVPDRIRLGGLSEKSRSQVFAATLLAKSEGIEFEEAFARINGAQQGAKPAETPAPTPAPEMRTPEVIKADIDALKVQKKQAAADLDTTKMFEIDEQIETLRDEMQASREAVTAQQSREQAQFETGVNSSRDRALASYPDAGVVDSPFQQKMIEIADRLEAQGNDLVFQADAPWKIAQMAGNELGIAPVDPGAKPAAAAPKPSPSVPAKPQAVHQRAVSKTAIAASPASGAARTSTPGSPAPIVGNIRTQHDYEKMVRGMTGSRV